MKDLYTTIIYMYNNPENWRKFLQRDIGYIDSLVKLPQTHPELFVKKGVGHVDNDNALLINDYEEHNMSKEGRNMCFHRNIVEGVASSMPKEEKVFTKDDKYDLKRMIEKALDKIFSTDRKTD